MQVGMLDLPPTTKASVEKATVVGSNGNRNLDQKLWLHETWPPFGFMLLE
jgi:hypothetical protein